MGTLKPGTDKKTSRPTLFRFNVLLGLPICSLSLIVSHYMAVTLKCILSEVVCVNEFLLCDRHNIE
jgi:hypothetical protein